MKNGYTFTNWSVGDAVFNGTGITSDTTVIATWQQNAPKYSQTFTYSGMDKQAGYYTFVVPYTGIYKVTLSGANGAKDASNSQEGLGAVITGDVELEKGTKLYIYVGGKGLGKGEYYNQKHKETGGYNGGGYVAAGGTSGGGGGATDIRTINGMWNSNRSLHSRIAVAAGGGGAGSYNKGGDGGWDYGLPGTKGDVSGGNQTEGGGLGDYAGDFGKGGNNVGNDGAGGGSGWFGGGAPIGDFDGSGGSSFMLGGKYTDATSGEEKTMSYQNSKVSPNNIINPATAEDYIFNEAKLIGHNDKDYKKDDGNGWATIKLVSQ